MLMCRKSPGEVRRRRRSGRQIIWKAAVVILTKELLLKVEVRVSVFWLVVVTVSYRLALHSVWGCCG